MSQLLLLLLRFYKYAVSPMLGQNCRFYPSCSEYAAEAIRVHGAAHGSWLAGKRLCKCHPWHEGGVDLVPKSDRSQESDTESKQNNAENIDSSPHPTNDLVKV